MTSRQGRTIFRVSITPQQQAGQLFAPMHFTDQNSGAGRTGLLVHSAADPVSGQPGFKNVPVAIEAYTPQWRGFLLTREQVTPGCRYWACARITDGWLTELACDGTIDVDSLLPPGPRREISDRARGMIRISVSNHDEVLEAVLFVTRSGELPERSWIERQFASSEAAIDELLAGRPSTPQPDRGKLVCVCHDVGETTVRDAIDAGADSVAKLGEATRAGTNCGSCRPILARLLDESARAARERA